MENKRDFPWRPPTLKLRKGSQASDPYRILISEVMLQQTQTYRVLPKYQEWIKKFPDFKTLSVAPFSDVLKVWSGLGYNRRALYLHKISKQIIEKCNGKLPLDPKILQTFSGIGKNTAGAIYVFSTNKPHVFIETNIRRTFIHLYFQKKNSVHDKDILTLVEKSIDKDNPREWYYALMDYGAYLAKHPPADGPNPNQKSAHYAKQSKFEGSIRQVRGNIIKLLIKHPTITLDKLETLTNANHKQFNNALQQLKKEAFLTVNQEKVSLIET